MCYNNTYFFKKAITNLLQNILFRMIRILILSCGYDKNDLFRIKFAIEFSFKILHE